MADRWQDALYPEPDAEATDPFADSAMGQAGPGAWLPGDPPPWMQQHGADPASEFEPVPPPESIETPENAPAQQPTEVAPPLNPDALPELPWAQSPGYDPQLIDEQLAAPQAYGEFGVEPETVAAGAYQGAPDAFSARVADASLARPTLSETLYPGDGFDSREETIQGTLDDEINVQEWESDALAERIAAKQDRGRTELERRQKDLALRIEEARQNNLEARRRAVEGATSKMEEIRNRRLELSRAEVDPDRWWGSRSTGQKAAAYIAAAIQGWLNPGGRNSAVELMQQAIRDDIALQERNIGREMSLLGEESGLLQWHLNQGLSLEAARYETEAAGLKQMADAIASDAAKFDEFGTSKERAELERRKALAEAEKAERAARQAEEDRLFKNQKEALELESKLKNDAASRANTYSQVKERKEKLRLEREKAEAERQKEVNRERLLERDEMTAAMRRAGIPQDQRSLAIPVNLPGGRLEAALAPNAEKVNATTTQLAAASSMGEIIDEINNIRVAEGFQSDTINSDSLGRVKALRSQLLMQAKNFFELGAITPADMDLVEGMLGGDPAGWKDVTAQLSKTKELLERGMRSQLKSIAFKHYADYKLPVLSPIDSPARSAEGARDEIIGAMRLGTFEEARGRVDDELRRFDEEGYDKSLRDAFLKNILKHARAAESGEMVEYIQGLMK